MDNNESRTEWFWPSKLGLLSEETSNQNEITTDQIKF